MPKTNPDAFAPSPFRAISLVAATLCLTLSTAARADLSLLQPPRALSGGAPLQLTLLATHDGPGHKTLALPNKIVVRISNDDFKPTLISLKRAALAPAHVTLSSGQFRRITYAADLPKELRGSVRVERLAGPVPELPGFADGAWWVQDAAAALPAKLMGDVRGRRVADLCAAPGGKTAQLVLAGADVTAVDTSRSRLARLQQNLARLDLSAETVQADLLAYEPPKLFDAVLLDAPCSSTGTVRRHPDVPWTKTPDDIAKLADLQRRLLERATMLVRPGGTVVFSNCSLDPQEGENLLAAFLSDHSGIALDPVRPGEVAGIAPFLTEEGTLRTTPAALDLGSPALSGLDGFFAARLRRSN